MPGKCLVQVCPSVARPDCTGSDLSRVFDMLRFNLFQYMGDQSLILTIFLLFLFSLPAQPRTQLIDTFSLGKFSFEILLGTHLACSVDDRQFYLKSPVVSRVLLLGSASAGALKRGLNYGPG